MWNALFFLQLISGPNEPEPLPSNTTVAWGVFGYTNGTPQLGYSPADWSGTGVKYVSLTLVCQHTQILLKGPYCQ